jgi:hypothetical protein
LRSSGSHIRHTHVAAGGSFCRCLAEMRRVDVRSTRASWFRFWQCASGLCRFADGELTVITCGRRELQRNGPESLVDDVGDAWHRQAVYSTTNRSANSVTSSQLKWWPPSAVSTLRPACVTAAENSSSLPTGLK